MRILNLSIACGLLALFLISLFVSDKKESAAIQAEFEENSLAPRAATGLFIPLINPQPTGGAKEALGKRLFLEPRLSSDNSISCASCHDLDAAGVDGIAVSVGVNGATGPVNAPTVFNAGLNIAQFWDGRAATLEEQAHGPLQNEVEMNSTWPEILSKLRNDAEYSAAFNDIYADGITPTNVVDAIAAFERTLIAGNSRFDQFLQGGELALSEEEIKGLALFTDYGCASCHQGIGLGGNMFQVFGVFEGYFDQNEASPSDFGRYNVTGRKEDRFVFKVPSLRNVAVTGPYFHDGSAETLSSAVTIMGKYQLGLELGGDEVRAIEAFLQSLTGEWNGRPLQ